MTNDYREMIYHLDNIIKDIQLLKKEDKYNLKNVDIVFLENSIVEIKKNLKKEIDLEKVKIISNNIYQLNVDNDFSKVTDHISNEFYAFEFLLEQKLEKTLNTAKRG